MNIAVIDIGTNTFNLLIVDYTGNEYELILKAKEPVKLGRGGITNSMITADAIERGIKALKKFKAIINNYYRPLLSRIDIVWFYESGGTGFIKAVKLKANIYLV